MSQKRGDRTSLFQIEVQKYDILSIFSKKNAIFACPRHFLASFSGTNRAEAIRQGCNPKNHIPVFHTSRQPKNGQNLQLRLENNCIYHAKSRHLHNIFPARKKTTAQIQTALHFKLLSQSTLLIRVMQRKALSQKLCKPYPCGDGCALNLHRHINLFRPPRPLYIFYYARC